ncbi:thioredoxin-like protein [Amylocarpus encephaloides]|uniref:Thioredoxin-like protein n=1 Tax=Amylocarpus encephaloides TaxID=45428 RepID=A0A9P8CA19_9HELO|nr:thioredoxin-like protein [Amylocarpus encephaloides]
MFRPTLRKMTVFNIEIVSDTVCPWCYVGKQQMDKAIKAYRELHPDSKDSFHTTWMPFYLNPAAPKIGVDKIEFYNSKFGEDRVGVLFERLSQVGKDAGIHFKFGGKTGNTRTSHRLIQLGKTKSPAMQTRVVEELFRLYFENEGDITSLAAIAQAGIKAGLPEVEVKEWLESEKGGPEVDREVEAARVSGVSGVPNFTVNGKFEVGGAQDPGVFLRVFERIKAGEKGQVEKGTVCG